MEGAISSGKDDSEITTGDDNSNSEEDNNGNEDEPSGDTPIDRPGDDNGNENTPVFVTGELLCSSEYDDGLLLSDGTWEYLVDILPRMNSWDSQVTNVPCEV